MAETGVCFAYTLLFVYAAVNKILDFDNFQIQLAQSPLLSSFAAPISYAVPVVEILLAVGLSFGRTRLLALYGSFGLMVMFTAYIVIILKFSPFVPCSCGGILEKLGWQEHLVFNAVFVLLGLVGILLASRSSQKSTPFLISSLGGTFIGSAVLLAVLFLLSEDMIHRRNNFTRRFPHHPATLDSIVDLKVNSYYIAGASDGKVYLGNSTAPLVVTVVDSTMQLQRQITIKLSPARDMFYSLQLSVRMPYFYLSDGKTPIVYRGLVGEWTATIWTQGTAYFNAFEPIDGHRAVFRAVSSAQREHILGLFTVFDSTKVKVNRLLDKQTDGIFDTAGTLIYNPDYQKILYTYLYRNEYLVIDGALQTKIVRHTIDTSSHVRIKTRYNSTTKERKLASPGRTVNNRAQTYRQYLFVNSALMGQYEPAEMWDKASVVDVYDFNRGTYAFSFYLTHIMKQPMSDFIMTDTKAYVLCGSYLSSYRLTDDFYQQ